MKKLNQNLKFGPQQHKRQLFFFIKITNKRNLIFKVLLLIFYIEELLVFFMERSSKGVFATTVT